MAAGFSFWGSIAMPPSMSDDLTTAYMTGFHERDDEVWELKKRVKETQRECNKWREIVATHLGYDGPPWDTSCPLADALEELKRLRGEQ